MEVLEVGLVLLDQLFKSQSIKPNSIVHIATKIFFFDWKFSIQCSIRLWEIKIKHGLQFQVLRPKQIDIHVFCSILPETILRSILVIKVITLQSLDKKIFSAPFHNSNVYLENIF